LLSLTAIAASVSFLCLPNACISCIVGLNLKAVVTDCAKVFLAAGCISDLTLVPASASKSASSTVLPGNEPLAKSACFAANVFDGSADIPSDLPACTSSYLSPGKPNDVISDGLVNAVSVPFSV